MIPVEKPIPTAIALVFSRIKIATTTPIEVVMTDRNDNNSTAM
jgi:hypothetical protein